MKKIFAILLFSILVAACASTAAATQPVANLPVDPEVAAVAAEHLRTRGEVRLSEAACLAGSAENPLPHPAGAEDMAFAEGMWRVDSRRNNAAINGESGEEWVDERGLASIEVVNQGNGYVEYYAGGWNGALFLDTTFWGSAGFADRWAVVEASPATGLVSLSGNYDGETFAVNGDMFGKEVEMRIATRGGDEFFWELVVRNEDGDYESLWTKHYVRLNGEEDAAAAEGVALGGLVLHGPHENHLQPFEFWAGEWDWYESHVAMNRDCAEGQAAINITNDGQAIEERAISSYDPVEANAETYADYSLTVWNEELQEFENYWWTNGAIRASYSHGECLEVDGEKVCTLRAEFRPSADENTIIWGHESGIVITWERK